MITGEIIGDSHAFVAIVKTQHGVQISLETQTGTEIAVGIENVGTAVGEQSFRHIGGSNQRVGVRNLPVELDVTCHMSS